MSGINLFLKYAYAPNIRGFCGPRDITIIEEGLLSGRAEKITDMPKALANFTGALPYLQLIAGANKIKDPFDLKVVEAYWIGNDLLNKVTVAKIHTHLADRFKKRVTKKTLDLITKEAPIGAKPHHSFHVFDAFIKIGGFNQLNLPEPIITRIDECRIGWGVFEKYTDSSKNQIVVRYLPIESQISNLKSQNNGLKFKIISNEVDGYKLFSDLKKGDLVTFHWSRICDKITKDQAKRLGAWTKYHMTLVKN